VAERRLHATGVVVLMAAVSLAVRLHNVAVFPGTRAPDGFGHFTYIWHLASTGTIPLATAGWSFFHPPLYYAWMASVWNALAALDASTRLKVGTAVIAAAGLVHAVVALALVRRRYPGRTVLHVATAAFLLFLPVQLYSAGYLGNEALNAILCSLAVLATLRLLEHGSIARAVTLGLLLGLAMLTKFTALAMVGGSLASIGLHALFGRKIGRNMTLAATAVVVSLATCGWFYLRNYEVYGTPFRMSRDTLAVSRVENVQSQGERGLAEFLLFDPMIVVRPQWPRGLPLTGDFPLVFARSPLRESVWTGMFANTFFDAVGDQVLPSVTRDEGARRAGQILLALALFPTVLVLAGTIAILSRLFRSGWNDCDGTVMVCFAASMALFVYGARAVPMHAAIKATYLMSSSAMFAYCFAAGLDLLDRRLPSLRTLALGACAALAVTSIAVFTLGTFVCRDYLAAVARDPASQNIEGVVAYAGGDRGRARHLFEQSAATDWHLAQENLAALALDDGQVLESVYRMRLAAALQPAQSFGLPADRAAFDRRTQAEYRNSIGAAYYELGWLDLAEQSLRKSLELDSSIPETSFDLGIVDLTRSLDVADAETRREREQDAARSFARALELDPGFRAAARLASSTATVDGSCRDVPPGEGGSAWTPRRSYPVETTTGDVHASALQRRRHILQLRNDLRSELAGRGCLPEG
jgi:tetratricopeptide (TPR) repeat protein